MSAVSSVPSSPRPSVHELLVELADLCHRAGVPEQAEAYIGLVILDRPPGSGDLWLQRLVRYGRACLGPPGDVVTAKGFSVLRGEHVSISFPDLPADRPDDEETPDV